MQKNTFYNKLVGCMTKKGQRQKAQRILDKSLFKISIATQKIPGEIIYNLAAKIGRGMELKTLKIRKNFTQVPFPIKKNRTKFLASSEIISILKVNRKKYDGTNKLSEHILSYLLPTGANYNNKAAFIKKILVNRSNLHYRY